MKIGDIVVLKKDSSLIGEVLAIDDMDMVKIRLCDTKIELTVASYELESTGATQCKRERAVRLYTFWEQSIRSLLWGMKITAVIGILMGGVIPVQKRSSFLTISRVRIASVILWLIRKRLSGMKLYTLSCMRVGCV